ncbi:MAG: hypothetical protein GW903_06495 [Alphaproteobacteria bacterium]|nr:hypothetical protein [Alphaproteobacteria bacterium]NCQ88530.1 hypothetical protein [Alphaproteobacteria bacterium]NCT06073.1 hypothetical protein [Alphaproteobacteria bacterium]
MPENEDNKAEFFTPPNTLKEKVGGGGIPEDKIQKSQAFINNNQIDYEPYAREYLTNVQGALKLAEGSRSEESLMDYMEEMTSNIMQLKASGAMFGYPAISRVADIVLNFVERAELINKDLYKIVHAHNICLDMVLIKKLKGPNNPEIDILVNELYDAITRYQEKYKS